MGLLREAAPWWRRNGSDELVLPGGHLHQWAHNLAGQAERWPVVSPVDIGHFAVVEDVDVVVGHIAVFARHQVPVSVRGQFDLERAGSAVSLVDT